jgi:hypothetical protein
LFFLTDLASDSFTGATEKSTKLVLNGQLHSQDFKLNLFGLWAFFLKEMSIDHQMGLKTDRPFPNIAAFFKPTASPATFPHVWTMKYHFPVT